MNKRLMILTWLLLLVMTITPACALVDIHRYSYDYHMEKANGLNGQALIAAAENAERRAERAAMLTDILSEDENKFTVVNTMFDRDFQKLQLVAWNSYTPTVTARLNGRYETFYGIFSPRDRMRDAHSATLSFIGDGRVLWQTEITSSSRRFSIEINVKQLSTFTIKLQTNDHTNSGANPGIICENLYLD